MHYFYSPSDKTFAHFTHGTPASFGLDIIITTHFPEFCSE